MSSRASRPVDFGMALFNHTPIWGYAMVVFFGSPVRASFLLLLCVTWLPAVWAGAVSHPHVFVTAKKVDGLRSVAELREGVKSGQAKILWDKIRRRTDADLTAPVLLPTTPLPGRDASSMELGNRDWTICDSAGHRVMRAALAWLITQNPRYRCSALRQMRSLFDTRQWPMWHEKEAWPLRMIDPPFHSTG